ncbi:MAG: hypothetical protein AAB472_00315 [Patescibacteria group bacterium]
MAIVFGSIFLGVVGALSSFVLTENKLQSSNTDKNKGFAIAEAGIEYYKWHLAHFPADLQNGTGVPGPYTIPYYDPETGAQTGTVTLTVTGNSLCGGVTSIDLESKGQSVGSTKTATIFARYARPTVAEYAYVLNNTVWAGADRIINGKYHSNGGIRMDGTANAPVTSSLSSWSCTSSYGCSPTATKDGVWGAGPNQNLWSFPVPQIDFSAIAANFTTLQATAQAQGIYYSRFSSGNGGVSFYKGYHLVFNNGGTVTVYKVTSQNILQAWPINNPSASSQISDYTSIKNETLVGTYTIPAACPLIYIEDHVWIEGVVSQKVTVVAADAVHSGVVPYVVIKGNITYATNNGSSGLTVISQGDVLISPNSPQNMNLNGIFIAQTGAFGRNLYACPSSYEPRGTLTIQGTTVSYKRTGTRWVNGCGSGSDAGYQSRIDSYDRKLATDPPPFTPYTSTDFKFVDWRQK